ncbi:hypothetical protein ACHAW5_009014 [Stephanodiscus triporus]|uniref:Adenylate cyclase n=1 Tax=Stephanodiscus triporus TaxID=2934178 RepID=A0ABD3NQH1_9STRA
METILDASFDALFVINDRGIIQKVNEASVRVFGWTVDELVGKNINIIMPEERARMHDSYLENYARTGIKKMIGTLREVEACKKDGSSFPCILGIAELNQNDGQQHYVGFIRDVTLQKSLLVSEAMREASDNLLYNILPKHIAERLKQDPSNIALFENTTILFADIVGFTNRSSTMSPREVVHMLNDIFSRFDLLVDKYDLNKVKTIGDCYMVTSIPSSELEHDGCARVCHFALDLMSTMCIYNSNVSNHDKIELRVGIGTGQVVAGEDDERQSFFVSYYLYANNLRRIGVLGSKRYLFDMWGDAVNTAARMEQLGIPGQIQVTKEVVESAGRDFHFECRGEMAVKGKGIMETYLLRHAKDTGKRHSMFLPVTPITAPAVRSMSDVGIVTRLDSNLMLEEIPDARREQKQTDSSELQGFSKDL